MRLTSSFSYKEQGRRGKGGRARRKAVEQRAAPSGKWICAGVFNPKKNASMRQIRNGPVHGTLGEQTISGESDRRRFERCAQGERP